MHSSLRKEKGGKGSRDSPNFILRMTICKYSTDNNPSSAALKISNRLKSLQFQYVYWKSEKILLWFFLQKSVAVIFLQYAY